MTLDSRALQVPKSAKKWPNWFNMCHQSGFHQYVPIFMRKCRKNEENPKSENVGPLRALCSGRVGMVKRQPAAIQGLLCQGDMLCRALLEFYQ